MPREQALIQVDGVVDAQVRSQHREVSEPSAVRTRVEGMFEISIGGIQVADVRRASAGNRQRAGISHIAEYGRQRASSRWAYCLRSTSNSSCPSVEFRCRNDGLLSSLGFKAIDENIPSLVSPGRILLVAQLPPNLPEMYVRSPSSALKVADMDFPVVFNRNGGVPTGIAVCGQRQDLPGTRTVVC